jgi:hypothetical protein
MVNCPDCGKKLSFHYDELIGEDGCFTLQKYYDCKYCLKMKARKDKEELEKIMKG